jgi:membrane fusion protein, multidrug efflux system
MATGGANAAMSLRRRAPRRIAMQRGSSTTRWLMMIAAVAIVAGGAFALARTSVRRPSPAPLAPAPVPVSVVAASVASHDAPIYLRGVGTVIAYNNVIVRSQITGQLVKINFIQGQTVKTGDLLGQIDPSPYQAQLDQAIANRDRDQAHLDNARIDLNRYTDLAKEKSVALQLADSQKAIVAQLVAMVKADEAIIQSAKVNLGYTDLTSPIDGVTGIRQIDIGNIIHPTDVNGLVDVAQIEPISLIFTLPETDFARVQERLAQGPLTVFVDSQNGRQLDQGTLNLIDNQIIQTTGTIRLRAEFPNQKHLLWPGQLVNVRLLLETQHNALTVNSSAVQQGPNGTYVYVVDSDTDAWHRRGIRASSAARLHHRRRLGGVAAVDALYDAGRLHLSRPVQRFFETQGPQTLEEASSKPGRSQLVQVRTPAASRTRLPPWVNTDSLLGPRTGAITAISTRQLCGQHLT